MLCDAARERPFEGVVLEFSVMLGIKLKLAARRPATVSQRAQREEIAGVAPPTQMVLSSCLGSYTTTALTVSRLERVMGRICCALVSAMS